MDEMNAIELLKEMTEQNERRKLLLLLQQCETLEEAKKKIEALLK